MSPAMTSTVTRRRLQQLVLATAGAALLPGARRAGAATPEATPRAYVPPTPACGDDDEEPTVAQTEGPYFTPNSPERTSLIEPGIEGKPLVLTGYVYSTGCQPVGKALLDVWHCDANGVYDNEGYRLRGHLFTDADGLFRLETIEPGIYTGRTRHIHLKVQAPNGPVLTTQLYFPNQPENARDGIFDPALLVELVEPARTGDPTTAIYTFIVETADA